ncbi:uncharacterized protein [Hyperolius riggenbachi]|uniref:uncharacterized protein n=1 Tax=Hyperolius riggenbachi TaxID=752182 RepID=UPI0035A305D5
MEEGQYIEGHQDLYKDAMIENQLPLTSPDQSSNRDTPERCTCPLYSQDCPHEGHTSPHHYQGGKLSVVVEEEKETYVRGDHQSIEKDDMMRTNEVEEEEMYVRSDQQYVEEGDMMRTIKEEGEETYVMNGQQSIEEGDMRACKEEEEMYGRSDQQSAEEGDMMTIKVEEEETYVRSDHQSMEEGDMMRTSKEYNVTEGRTVGTINFNMVGRGKAAARGRGGARGKRKRKRFVFDVDDLVARVQSKPQLYDKHHPKYKDTAANAVLWEEITSSFYDDWENEEKKAEKILDVRERWRSLRDNYKRDLDKVKEMKRSGAGSSTTGKYCHFEILDFLRPCFEGRETEDSSGPSFQTAALGNMQEMDMSQEHSVAQPPTSQATVDQNVRRRSHRKATPSNRQIDMSMLSAFHQLMDRWQHSQSQLTDTQKIANGLVPLMNLVSEHLRPHMLKDIMDVIIKYQATPPTNTVDPNTQTTMSSS